MNREKAFLIILDGWGHGQIPDVSAIARARTSFVDRLYKEYPNSELVTFGEQVGLPAGQMGNSEVGHLNIGAGRIVYQELARINNAIADGSLENNDQLCKALDFAAENQKAVHILGLLSDGGVHSHIDHIKALCSYASKYNLETYVHAFMDGRDTDPRGGKEYIRSLMTFIDGSSVSLSSVVGRYYAMDRDHRWERIKYAYDLLVKGEGELTSDVQSSIQAMYDRDVTDEFLLPIKAGAKEKGIIQPGDVVLFANFRTDRPRQLMQVLSQDPIKAQGMTPVDGYYITMTRYDKRFKDVHVIFEKEILSNTIGEYVSGLGLKQLRIAETEKYPHVTYFFSGGREQPFEGEERILVNSPKVATYDLQPEMSAYEMTDKVVDNFKDNAPDLIILNFANADMVGHTGVFEAAVKAAETVDACLEVIIPKALAQGYNIVIIADHGNSDIMRNPDGSPHTAHTTNPVPCIVLTPTKDIRSVRDGKLADIAPTLLYLMGIPVPGEMTGDILVDRKD